MILLVLALLQSQTSLASGMVLTKSTTFKTGQKLVTREGIVIKGHDLTIDFKGSILLGAADVVNGREGFEGSGILLEGCRNIVVKNATVQGYRFNIKVADCLN